MTKRRAVTFEDWKYQWCHELALMIDNDPVLLRKMRAFVGEIIDFDWDERMGMVIHFEKTLAYRLEIDHPRRNAPGDHTGWLELLEHYTAKVLEERSYE